MAGNRRGGRRRKDNIVTLAFEAGWEINAIMCVASLLANGLFHAMFKSNPYSKMLFSMSDTATGLFALLCGVLALYKFSRSQMQMKRSRSEALSRIEPIEPSIVQGWKNTPPAQRALIHSIPEPVRERGPQAWSLELLREMEWKRFEEICLAFYRAKGIRAESTPLGPDGGVDVRLYQDEADAARCTAIVQCKAWNAYVGVAPIRELRGVMAHEKIEKAFFMTPSQYSDDAKAFAAENRITLIDGTLFLAMLKRLPAEVGQRLLKQATKGDWTTPTCPSCGTKMVAREGKGGRFWGCATYPRCRQKLGMRA